MADDVLEEPPGELAAVPVVMPPAIEAMAELDQLEEVAGASLEALGLSVLALPEGTGPENPPVSVPGGVSLEVVSFAADWKAANVSLD